MSETKYDDTTTAAYRLGISAGRIRQLLGERRIEGAFKIAGFWKIPVHDGKPKIKRAPMRPRKGSWDGEYQPHTKKAMIHIHGQQLKDNHKKKKENPNAYLEPPIIIRRGGKPETKCHRLEIEGPCVLVYNPYKPRNHAVLWIEVSSKVKVVPTIFEKVVAQMETS